MAITPLLNVFLNYNDTRQPVLVSAASLVPARGIQVVGGEKVTLRVYFVNTTGASPSYVVPVEADTIRFTAKKQASDEDLIYLFDEWTISGTYIETTADFATVEGFWDTATDAAKSLISNIEVETEAGLVRKWPFFTQVVRQSYGGEDPPVNPGETYVKYTAQTPTSEQQAQARANIGAGTSSFNPASPGPIGGTTPGVGTFSSANLGTGGTDDLIVVDGPGGTVIYSGSHSFRGGATFGTSAEAEFTTGGALSVPSLTIGGNTLALGGENVQFATFGASFVQSESVSDALTELGLTSSDAVTFGTVTIGTSTLSTTANKLSCSESFGVNGGLSVSGAGVWTNTGNTVTISGLGIVGNDGTNDVFELDVVNGTFSSALGAFSISANGDMTATHGKFQGSGGQAGHIQLKQGTTPNGTANETTVWGIAGGIGWRDGTGTAYSLTLPTATGTIGVLASATEELAGTSTTVTSSPATGHVKQLYQAYRTALNAFFVQAISGAGASTATTDWGVDVTGPTTAVGYGIRRNTPTNQFAASRGKGRGVIAWGRRFEIVGTACIYAGLDAQAVFRITFGKTTGDNAGNLARRGLGFRVQGTGALEIETHNGTTRTASTNSTFTPTANQAFDFRITSDGAGNCVLWVNDAQVATCTGGPTTDSSSTENAFQIEIENVSTVTTQSSATAGNFGVYMARS